MQIKEPNSKHIKRVEYHVTNCLMTCEASISNKTKGTVQSERELNLLFPVIEMYYGNSTTLER